MIGYAAGVFDMFHVGHLNLLRRASEHCDQLVVGVTTDELCLARKGKSPIVPFAERLKIVESIRYVDAVIPQTTMDKMAAWEKIGFSRIFVGDDWQGTPTWAKYEADFAQVNVEVVYLPYTVQTSSTILRERLLA